MEKLYIISIDTNGSGADSLTQSIKERNTTCLEYWQHLVDNKLVGKVTVREDIVNDERWVAAKIKDSYYFDTLDREKTKVLFQKEYHPHMMKSKADLERQIQRIAANHSNHRLYYRAQSLVMLYNHNMSETLENSQYWKEWCALNRNPTKKEQADAVLQKMHETPYHRNLYTARNKKNVQ